MRLHQLPPSLASLVATILLSRRVAASFIPELLHNLADLQDLNKRCSNPCGYYGQLCCEANQACYTDSNDQAQCSAVQTAAAQTTSGQWEYYTTTYVQTDLKTVTATFSSFVAATTLSCAYSLGETPCGNVCCLSGQYCQSSGSCVDVGGSSSGYYTGLYTVTTVVTNTASAPLRPTSNTLVTVTSIGTATTTQPFISPVGTSGSIITGSATSSGGLSGGAIAGIVIGVIAGIILLLLICACFCFKGLLDGLLAIFGLGPRRRREEVIVEERHSHRSGRAGRTWFGTRPSRRTEVIEEKRRSSGWGPMAAAAAFLGGLALLLGLKRRRDRREEKSSSGYGSGYYSDYTVSSKYP